VTRRGIARTGWIALGLAWALYALQTAQAGFGVEGGPFGVGPDLRLSNAIVLASAAICLARPLRRPGDRLAWLLLGAGLAAWAAGDIYYSVAFADTGFPPLPSISDGLWLLIYPACATAMILLARRQFSRLHATLLVDGAIAALAATAVCVGALWTPVLDASSGGGPLALATLLAYPLGDALLLGLVAAVFTLVGWRPDRTWALLGAGVTAVAIADGLVTYLSATSDFVEGTALDSLFPAGALLLALAAWQPAREEVPVDVQRWGMLLTPAVCAVIATSLMVFDHFFPLITGVVVLAAATMGMILVRMGFTFHENLTLLARRREESVTDHLTGLANRRGFDDRLAAELERAVRHGRALSLVIVDLDHFKEVNDVHGHAAGDAVIAHVAGELRARARFGELVARIGGEEFAWMLPETSLADATRAAERARAGIAGSPAPGGLRVTLSAGAAELEPGIDAAALCRRADEALYRAKAAGRDRVVGAADALGVDLLPG
jgi:diguanylate cyclase (GGDEF)-like protein